MNGNKRRAKHLILISYDAFSEDNWEMASKLPNMSMLIENGAHGNRLESIYPTLTYVIHTTMVTGVYPNKHGVIHNNPLQPFENTKDQRWYWFRNDVKVPTIYDAAKKNKLKTAGLLWPVTGKSSINYNIPEIRAVKKENQALKILKTGSPIFTLDMNRKYGSMRKGIEQPYLDDFTTACAIDTIKRKKPNLFLIHLIDLDDAKHSSGTDGKEMKEVITRMDHRIGQIMKAVEDAGIKDDTVFLVIGDHGQLNVRYKVRLNRLLQEKGLIWNENGQMRWRAYIQSSGGSAYLHIKDGDNKAKELALNTLKEAMDSGRYGIEHIFDRKELDSLFVDASIPYVIEAQEGYSFEDEIDGPTIYDLSIQGEKYATHGYLPDKPDYKCNLIISGSGIKNNYTLKDIQMVDIAPTMANILGIEFKNCDGRVLEEIFQS